MATSPFSLKRSLPGLWLGWVAQPSDYAFGLGIVVAATLVGLPLRGVTDAGNLTMIYLTGVGHRGGKTGDRPGRAGLDRQRRRVQLFLHAALRHAPGL
ncbi:MAG: hypothetical protein WDN06_17235 [Asticcacaulis sp.]